MKATAAIISILGLTAAVTFAAPPSQPTVTRYSRLYTDSPFTSKPEVEAPRAEESIFKDLSLGGVSKLKDGWFVVLINKKDPSKRGIVGRGDYDSIKVENVTRKGVGWRSTVVELRSGSKTGSVEFEENLIAVKQQAPPKQANPNSRNQADGEGGRRTPTPRPRVIVPPNQNTPTSNTSNRSTRRSR